MRIIAKRALRTFWTKHPDSETPLKLWFKNVANANWQSLNDLKTDYSTADYVGNGRVVFNIKGNHYRLIVKVEFEFRVVFIKFVGTHSAYDKIDAKTVDSY